MEFIHSVILEFIIQKKSNFPTILTFTMCLDLSLNFHNIIIFYFDA